MSDGEKLKSVNITGIGVLLQTPTGSLLFQERDKNIKRNPGKIAPFGGGIETGETTIECAIRELDEELDLKVTEQDLQKIGDFESHFTPGSYIQMFLVKNVQPENISLHEGKSIKNLNVDEALKHSEVTDFTKEVLRVYEQSY